jgi:hypothetical protein
LDCWPCSLLCNLLVDSDRRTLHAGASERSRCYEICQVPEMDETSAPRYSRQLTVRLMPEVLGQKNKKWKNSKTNLQSVRVSSTCHKGTLERPHPLDPARQRRERRNCIVSRSRPATRPAFSHAPSELCPILCPPPNPTECDGLSNHCPTTS